MRAFLWCVAAFLLAALLVYGGSLHDAFVFLDDDILIFQNPASQELSMGSVTWVFTHFDPELYIPLTFVSYQLTHVLGGADPFWFHLTDLCLHVANALLVLAFTALLSRDRRVGVLCGALFLLHPLHTEAVAWASARKDTLSTFFLLCTLLAWLRYRESGDARGWYLSALAAFLLGLLSKASILLAPAALLLIDWREGRPLTKRTLAEAAPFAMLSIIFGCIALLGKREVLARSPLGTTLLMAAKSTGFYLQKLVWPADLSVLYPYQGEITLFSPAFLVPVLLLLCLLAAAALSLRRTREALFAAAFFLIFLAPSFTNYAKNQDIYLASDRYAYVPSVALFFLAALGVRRLMDGASSGIRKGTAFACIALLVTLGAVTLRQTRVWADTDTLFTHMIGLYPDSALAQNKVGASRIRQERYAEAVTHLTRSVTLSPSAGAYYNLGVAYLSLRRDNDAYEATRKAVELDPAHVSARLNLAYFLTQRGVVAAATEQLEAAERLAPRDIDVLTGLAALYLKQERPADAAVLIARALEMDPANADAVRMAGLFE